MVGSKGALRLHDAHRWSSTKDPAGKSASGEVLWNGSQQRGTTRFRGLAKNEPARAQYQLWIFDKTRERIVVAAKPAG